PAGRPRRVARVAATGLATAVPGTARRAGPDADAIRRPLADARRASIVMPPGRGAGTSAGTVGGAASEALAGLAGAGPGDAAAAAGAAAGVAAAGAGAGTAAAGGAAAAADTV